MAYNRKHYYDNWEHYQEYHRDYAEAHRGQKNLNAIKYREKLKREVFEHYGGSPPKCDCCGETEMQFLTIDHMNGDGNKLRVKLGPRYLYPYLRKNNWPKGYRVLCMNCNFSIGHYGFCPHNGGYC